MSCQTSCTHGYDAVFSSNIPDDLICIICHLVLRDPVHVIECGHCYCSPCYNQLVEYSNRSSTPLLCPVDKQHIEADKVFQDKRMMRTIMNLNVKCSAYELGCEWSGSLGDLGEHDERCDHIAKHNSYSNNCSSDQNINKELLHRMSGMEDNLISKDKEIASLKFTLKEMKGNYEDQLDKLKKEVKSMRNHVNKSFSYICLRDINQEIMDIDDSIKGEKLVEILRDEGVIWNLVIVQTKSLADFLESFLCDNGFLASSIHGNRFQQQREALWELLGTGQQTVLIATAVAARGLTIANVNLVINYDLPDEIDEYIHRLGRTGDIGNKGKAISFFSRGKDEGLARALVRTLLGSNQQVPDWLEEVAELALGTGFGSAWPTTMYVDGFGDNNVSSGGNDDEWNNPDDEEWD